MSLLKEILVIVAKIKRASHRIHRGVVMRISARVKLEIVCLEEFQHFGPQAPGHVSPWQAFGADETIHQYVDHGSFCRWCLPGIQHGRIYGMVETAIEPCSCYQCGHQGQKDRRKLVSEQ
jgi:hypothetical protein